MVYPRRKNQSIYQSQVNGKYKSRHIQTFLTVEVKKKKKQVKKKKPTKHGHSTTLECP
jgi:hypothetical protein